MSRQRSCRIPALHGALDTLYLSVNIKVGKVVFVEAG